MKNVVSRIKPKSGFSYFVHIFFNALVPTLVYIAVRVELVPIALLIILLGKWRVFSVRPRHWWPNIRANAVDVLVGVSMLGFMVEASSAGVQATFAIIYGAWLLLLKPRSTTIFVALQALVALALSLTALFLLGDGAPLWILVISSGIIGYVCSRHFLFSFDEPHAPFFAHTWGYFCAAITWLLGHWMLYYLGVVSQIAVLITIIGFSIASLYYLEQQDKLSKMLQKQIIFLLIIVTIIIVVFSNWGDRAI